MKPPPFEYLRASNPEEAVAALAAHGGDAKLIAGGQSLMPMLNFRLLEPELLIDISEIASLKRIEKGSSGRWVIGAGVRHRDILVSEVLGNSYPILRAAMTHVAHVAIRNRGTIGGSLAHGDPAAEWPMLALLLDAEIEVLGRSGQRMIEAKDFFLGALHTSLSDDEIILAIHLPPAPVAWGFFETARRAGDFALAGAGVLLETQNGKISEARIALLGLGETPIRVYDAEAKLEGENLNSTNRAAAMEAAKAACQPITDLHASAEFRVHLAGIMTGRSLDAAWGQAIC